MNPNFRPSLSDLSSLVTEVTERACGLQDQAAGLRQVLLGYIPIPRGKEAESANREGGLLGELFSALKTAESELLFARSELISLEEELKGEHFTQNKQDAGPSNMEAPND